jgi:hypothetical protein
VEIREPATGREERIFRGAGIDTTLGANHFGGRRTETRPLGRRRLGNKASTIWKMLFGVNEGDDDPARSSGSTEKAKKSSVLRLKSLSMFDLKNIRVQFKRRNDALSIAA